ncbi:MAG: ribosome maturation factor RimM [Chloroflexota bacterium]
MSPRRMLASQEPGPAKQLTPEFLAVGKLHRPHGVRGEIILEVLTDFPERIRAGMTLYIGEAHHPLRLRTRRKADTALLVSFDDHATPEAVGQLRNQIVYISAKDRPALPEGEFYHHQLIGKTVVSDDGRTLGALVEILETGANDVAVVRPENGPEILLPLIADVLLGVDEDAGVVRVHLLAGILPDDVEGARDDEEST